ncbi:hypothetical protein NQZ70_00558 [Sorangium sp. Soce836]|nr:hypothetical protein NQZ70_00558 [Sorangium sp. Soce836]
MATATSAGGSDRAERSAGGGDAGGGAEGGASAAERAPHPSAARVVTLFEDRAEVVRAARVEVGAGAQWIAIGGVSVFVDERTVQARVAGAGAEGAVRVTAARVRWRAHREAALGREAIDALEREQREASRRAGAAERARDRASRREAHLDQLLAKWAQAMSEVPKDAGEPARLASWRAGVEALHAALAEALGASADARAARAHAEDDARRAAARLREGSIEQPRFEAVVEVEVHAPAPQPVEIELTYRVACAIWRPEHLARLSAPPAGAAAGAGGAGVRRAPAARSSSPPGPRRGRRRARPGRTSPRASRPRGRRGAPRRRCSRTTSSARGAGRRSTAAASSSRRATRPSPRPGSAAGRGRSTRCRAWTTGASR